MSLWWAQGAQVAFVLLYAPLLRGFLERYRARLAGRHGPPIWQPFRDLRKWWNKETVRSGESTWISHWAPLYYFLAPVTVTMLIPALTSFPLPLAWMGDMLAGGMILGGAGFVLLLAALDSGSVYPALGASRVRLVGTFTESLALLLVFAAASLAGTTIPYTVNQTLASPGWLVSATHGLVILGWFALLIAETGRIPIDNPSTSQELSMIDPARTFEASGRDLALYEWGGWMKFLVLSVVLTNVLGTPWGLARQATPTALAIAAVAVALKTLLAGLLLVSFEAGFAKLRLIRTVDFIVAGTLLAGLGALAATMRL